MGRIETFQFHTGSPCATTMKQKPRVLTSNKAGAGCIMRDARYVEIPGSKTHELPPLLVHSATERAPADEIDSLLGEAEDMLSVSGASPDVLEQRRFELALQLREHYKGFVS